MADISQLSDADLQAALAQSNALSPLDAIRQIESGGAPDSSTITNAKSGASGAFQTMAATVKDPGFGVKPSNGTVQDNARVGRDYFNALAGKYGGDQSLAAAAYNWGPGNVDKWLKNGADLNKLPTETLNYVLKFQDLTHDYGSAPGGGQSQGAQAKQTQDEGPGFLDSVGQSLSQAAQHPIDALTSLGGGLGRGVQQIGLGAQNLLGRGLESLGADSVGQWLQKDAIQGNTAGQQQASALPNQGFAKTGEIAGQALPALFVPGGIAAQGAAGAGIGAADAAAQGKDALDVLGNAAIGGAGGAVGAGIAKGVGGLIGGVGGPEIQALRAAGVRPSIGQTLGGLANKVEQKATSAPLYGDAINAGRQGAINQFNKGVVNEALDPIGASLGRGTSAGVDAVSEASQTLSNAWNGVLPQATFAADAPFMSGVQSARQSLANAGVPQQVLDRFDSLVSNNLLGRVGQNGTTAGTVYQPGESILTQFVRNVNKNVASNADDRALAGAVSDVVNAARDSLQRNSGQQVADQLANVRQAYARFKTVEAAAGSKAGGQTDSLFTPQAFNRAVKSAASQGQRARGQAFGQDLSEAAVNRLGSSVPDSGTAGRLAQAGGIGALGAGAIANPLAAAGYVGGAGLAHLLYSNGGRAVTSALLSARPDLLRALGGTIGGGSNITGGLLGSLWSNK